MSNNDTDVEVPGREIRGKCKRLLRFTQSRKAGVTEMKKALTSNGIYYVFENSKPIGVVDSFLGVSSTNSFLDPLPVKCFQHGEYEDESINYSQSMKLG
jgi:hypothetical protein